MDLAEFKKENEGKPETLEELEKKPVALEVVPETVNEPWMVSEDDTPVVEDELKVDDEPKPEEEEKKNDQIPLKKFMKQKRKLQNAGSELTEKDKEIERLRLENESFKSKALPPKTLVRPKSDDYASDDEYHDALDNYYIDSADDRTTRKQIQTNQETQQVEYAAIMASAVDDHHDRADVMIQKAKIKKEVYEKSEDAFRDIVKSVYGENGDFVADNMIADMDEGSEKVVFYVGKNKNAGNEFRSLLIKDPNGIKAAIYLGKQIDRFTNQKKAVSLAPEPAAQLKGGSPKATGSEQKEHEKLIAKGDNNAAFAIRRAARLRGENTDLWE